MTPWNALITSLATKAIRMTRSRNWLRLTVDPRDELHPGRPLVGPGGLEFATEG